MAKRIHRSGRPGKPGRGAPKPKSSQPPSRRISHRPARPSDAALPPAMMMPKGIPTTPERVQAVRELFWQNVIREILTSLVMLSLRISSKGGAATDHASGEGALDGRLGVITSMGQRIPIARIFPVFSATVGMSPSQMTLSSILECTVFQVHTPGGEVYTLPIQEVRGFHSLTEALMDELQNNSRENKDGEKPEPFGFAAFTSTSRTNLVPESQPETHDGMAAAD